MWHKIADNRLPVNNIMGNVWQRWGHYIYGCYTLSTLWTITRKVVDKPRVMVTNLAVVIFLAFLHTTGLRLWLAYAITKEAYLRLN